MKDSIRATTRKSNDPGQPHGVIWTSLRKSGFLSAIVSFLASFWRLTALPGAQFFLHGKRNARASIHQAWCGLASVMWMPLDWNSKGGGSSSGGGGGGGLHCFSCGLPGHIARFCNTVCTSCKNVGHTALNCPFPVCTICKGSHWSQNCTKGGPYRGASIWKGPNSCAECGQQGHFARDCPQILAIQKRCKK